MEPWYKVTTPRIEVREGRSFNPDEFAIALEQVVTGKAPSDYRDPKQFFDRTVFTRALNEHLGLVSGFERLWWKEPIGPEEVTFDDKTFLLTRTPPVSRRTPSPS